MSKAIFFDWDTLVARLKPVELEEARKFLGVDQIVQMVIQTVIQLKM